MVGRPKKPKTKIFRTIEVQSDDGRIFELKNILVKCPVCHSYHIGGNGTQKRKKNRIEGFKCKNPSCPFLEYSTGSKQFTLYSSHLLNLVMEGYLKQIFAKLFKAQGKLSNIGLDYGVSPSLMTYLSQKLQKSLDQQQGLSNLVLDLQPDRAISMDETFLKINGKAFYIIMASGYTNHKILGIKVSKTRKLDDLRDVFDEAERNTANQIEIITADAWNGTQALAKYLDRPITIIIHKHKAPYEKIVIKRYNYSEDIRAITTIGLKSDFCKKRGTKKYFFLENTELRYPPPKKKRGRRKGTKNSQGTYKPYVKRNVKRGRRGLFTVFDRGKRGYAKVDPYRKRIRIGSTIPKSVAAALRDVVKLYAKNFIQNNLAEHKNSLISNYLILSGPKTALSIENRLRSFIICRNNPTLLHFVLFTHKFQQEFLKKQFNGNPVLNLMVCG